MWVRLRYSNLFLGAIWVIIICECNGFRLFKVEDDLYKAVYLAVTAVILLICLLNKDILCVCKAYGKFTYWYIIFIFIFLIFEYRFTSHIYGNRQVLYDFVNYIKHYFLITLAMPLLYIFTIRNNVKSLLNSVLLLVTITLGLILLHSLFYDWWEIDFLNVSMYTKIISRNNRMRIWDLSSLEGLAIIYGSYCLLYEKRKKVMYLLQTAICIAALVYVEQTRMMLISLATCILFMIIMKRRKTAEGLLTTGALILLLGIIGGFYVIPKLFESFAINSVNGASTLDRLRELRVAFYILRNKGILGLGMINKNVQRHLFSNVTLEDIGLIGYMVQTGIWSVPLFIFPMFRMALILVHGIKEKFRIFLSTVYIYLLITSISLFILDSPRILMWPFCLALFEFYNKKCFEEYDEGIISEYIMNEECNGKNSK